jgi:hypothetical protein
MSKQIKVHTMILWLCCFGMLGLGIGLGMSGPTRAVAPREETEDGQPPVKAAAAEKPAPAAMDVGPPPSKTNDLSMEVAALRTLYLLNAWQDHNNGSWKYHSNAPWYYILDLARKNPPEPGRERKPATVSDKYKRVLTELRVAYIAGQDDRIVDLTDQLDELAEDEDGELDDVIEITANGRKNSLLRTSGLTTECIVNYLNAYGKEFPSPVNMIGRVMIDRKAGDKISVEDRKSVAKQVGFALWGFSPKAAIMEEKMNKFLEKASDLAPQACKQGWNKKGPLRLEYETILKGLVEKGQHSPNSFHMIEHLMNQDMAELFSNSRLVPAIEARVAYLKKAGYDVSTGPDDNPDN